MTIITTYLLNKSYFYKLYYMSNNSLSQRNYQKDDSLSLKFLIQLLQVTYNTVTP